MKSFYLQVIEKRDINFGIVVALFNMNSLNQRSKPMLKNCLISFKAKLSQVVDDLENHEAVAEAALDDLKKLRAKVHLESLRLTRQIQNLEAKCQSLAEEAARWQQRALAVAPDDKPKALACLQRLERAEEEQRRISETLAKTRAAARKVENELKQIDEALQKMASQLAILRARESRLQAAGLVSEGGVRSGKFQAIFDRWESQLESQDCLEFDEDYDPLAESFERQESEHALEEKLEALLKAKGGDQ